MKAITIGTILTDGNQNYTIEEHIGHGGFADVYRAASNKEPEKQYAIKVVRDSDPNQVYSFKNEFDVASKVNSEHAIKYYYMNEHGQNDYPCYIIMEYADGGSLDAELKERTSNGSPYSKNELLDIYTQLIDGMNDVNKVGVHRDIKPLNILKTIGGIYKISDYGLAKYVEEATRSASKTMKGYGTDLYYAPELWANPSAHGINDIQVDIYAMGIVFYQLANLCYPYDLNIDHRAMHMTSSIKPFSKEVDPVFQSLIRKMMEKSKAKRFNNWAQIKDFLNDSTIGNGKKRDPFVDSMLKNAAMKQEKKDAETAKSNMEESKRIESFRRLVSLIEDAVYNPLKEIVDAFNADSIAKNIDLGKMNIDDDDESISFHYSVQPLSDDDDERTIDFDFKVKHTEKRKPDRVFPILSSGYNNYDDMYDIERRLNPPERRTTEYKYNKNTILLWGLVKADCGAGFNIAILEDPADPLYGRMKTFIRTPNVMDNESWLPVETEEQLKKLCNMQFRELQYTTKVDDFDFEIVKRLIKQNEIYSCDTVKDPIEHTRMFPIM